jgi:hypothetical protein
VQIAAEVSVSDDLPEKNWTEPATRRWASGPPGAWKAAEIVGLTLAYWAGRAKQSGNKCTHDTILDLAQRFARGRTRTVFFKTPLLIFFDILNYLHSHTKCSTPK